MDGVHHLCTGRSLCVCVSQSSAQSDYVHLWCRLLFQEEEHRSETVLRLKNNNNEKKNKDNMSASEKGRVRFQHKFGTSQWNPPGQRVSVHSKSTAHFHASTAEWQSWALWINITCLTEWQNCNYGYGSNILLPLFSRYNLLNFICFLDLFTHHSWLLSRENNSCYFAIMT